MINLKETFEFLNKNNLTFEELGILLTIYYKNESKDIAERAKVYYKQSSVYEDLKNKRIVPIQYKDIVENLIQKGFIEDYRSEADKDANKIMLNKIKVTELFTDIYFVRKSDAYEYAKSLFPKMGRIDKPGGKVETYSAHAVDNEKMKEYFYTTLLQGGQKKLFEEFCYITKEIYEYQETFDNDGNIIGGSPQASANCKWDKYLLNFHDYKEEWEKNNSSSTNYNQFI